MAAQTPEAKPQDHYDKVHQATWTRRTASLFAGGTLGAIYGVVVGVVAAFLPFAFGAMGLLATAPALPAVGAVAASVGLFASILAVIGMTIGADVGANSAAITAGLAEKEKKDGVGKSNAVSTEKTPEPAKASGIYSWKAAPILVPLFAAFGALIASNPLTASGVASLSFTGGAFTAQSGAAIAASAAVFATGGALMAFKNSVFTNKLSNFYMDVFSGKALDRMTGNSPAAEPEQAVAQTPQAGVSRDANAPAVSQPARESRSFAADKRKFSLNSILEKTDERSAEQNVLVTR